MKLLLICNAGASTSLLVNAIKKYMDANGIEGKVEAKTSDSAKAEAGNYDVYLLAPQVKFMLDDFEKMFAPAPIALIPTQMYGLMDGEGVYKLALETKK